MTETKQLETERRFPLCHIYEGRKRTYNAILVFQEGSDEAKHLHELISFEDYYMAIAKTYITPEINILDFKDFFAIKKILMDGLDDLFNAITKICSDCPNWQPKEGTINLLEGLMVDMLYDAATRTSKHPGAPWIKEIDLENEEFVYSSLPS